MNRFQKIQKSLSIIPFYSTLFIIVVTNIILTKEKASMKYWFKYGTVSALSIISVWFLNNVIMSGNYIILNILASGLILALANFYLVDLQIQVKSKKCKDETEISNVDDLEMNKKGKKNLKSIISIGLVFTVIVTLFLGWRFYNSYKKIIKDTNGEENFSINTITKEKIDKTFEDDYTAFFSSFDYDGEHSNITEKSLLEADYDFINKSANSFSGIMIANATKTKANELLLKITSKVEKGNFAILVYIENKFYCDVTINSTETVKLSGVSNKTVYVKIVGEDAKMNVEILRI